MAIGSSDIKIRLSGGAANSDVNASLGGAKSSVETVDNTLNNLFDDTSGTESNAGDTEHRGLYVHNGHATLSMTSTKIYISSNTSSANDTFDIALAGEGVNATMETIAAGGKTGPVGESFSAPTDYAGGLSMGTIAAGQHYGFWVRRTTTAGASADDNVIVTLKYDCDTSA